MQVQNNPYLKDFLQELQERYSLNNLQMPTGEWVCKNTTLKGATFNTNRYPFQKQILDDMHQSVVVKKVSQVGLTEIQMRKVVSFLYRHPNTQGLFSFPDKLLRDAFAQTRLLPMLDGDKIFNPPGKKPVRAKERAQVAQSFLNVVIGNESAATSMSIDIMAIDEVDLTDQDVLALFQSRIQNSDYAIRQDFSTPTFADYGIDSVYNMSDQREYFCKCDACNHWQIPDWHHNWVQIPGLSASFDLEDISEHMLGDLDLDGAKVVCEKCHRELDLNSEDREWVAMNPRLSSHSHGYHVKPFSTGRLGIKYIVSNLIRYKKRDFLRGFHNTVLGRTYQDAKTRITEADVLANLGDPEVPTIDKNLPLFVGIDVGLICHVIIGTGSSWENPRVLQALTVPAKQLVGFVQELCNKYNIIAGAIDRYPYTPTAHEIYDLSRLRIYPIEYGAGSNNLEDKRNDLMPEEGYYRVHRTWSLDALAGLVRRHQLPMMGYGDHKEALKEHLQNMVRAEDPEKPAEWKKLSKDDHFFHALNYFVVAMRIKEFQDNLDGRNVDNRSCYGIMTPNMIIPDMGIISTTKNKQQITYGILG
jgi:hypothetical protein